LDVVVADEEEPDLLNTKNQASAPNNPIRSKNPSKIRKIRNFPIVEGCEGGTCPAGFGGT
jgi:hypothetical protein